MDRAAAHYPMVSLYVGDLNPDVTEVVLFEKFSTAGTVLSIRVCRDMITRRSLGYAYVNFQQHADAERALDTMNFDIINGRPIRIMWCQRDPSLRMSGAGNLFIKNLDKSIEEKDLYDTFYPFGNILSCTIARDENSVSRGYGFIHYETVEMANKTIEEVNGMLLRGKQVYVGRFLSRKERQMEREGLFTNVYVKNFGEDMTEDQLREIFGRIGRITSLKIVKKEDGESRGFAFVAFEEPQSAKAAVEELNGKELVENKPLYVGRAQKKAERQQELKRRSDEFRLECRNRFQGRNLYIKYLDDSVDEETLRKVFAPFGTITSAKVMLEEGRSKGFGFVCFSSPEEATQAVKEMNGRIVGTKPLYVTFLQGKEDRKAQLTSQIAQRMANIRMQDQVGRYISPGYTVDYVVPILAQQQPICALKMPTNAPRGGVHVSAAGMRNSYSAAPRHPDHTGAISDATVSQKPVSSIQDRLKVNKTENAGANRPTSHAGVISDAAVSQKPVSKIQDRLKVKKTENAGVNRPTSHAGVISGAAVSQKPVSSIQDRLKVNKTVNAGANRPPSHAGVISDATVFQKPVSKIQDRLKVKKTVNAGANRPPSHAGVISDATVSQKPVSKIQDRLKVKKNANAGAPEASTSANIEQAVHVQGQEPLTLSMLAAASPEERRQMLGERLFPLIQLSHADLASKITGMLLEMDNSDLLHMLDQTESLKIKVEHAVAVWEAYQANQRAVQTKTG